MSLQFDANTMINLQLKMMKLDNNVSNIYYANSTINLQLKITVTHFYIYSKYTQFKDIQIREYSDYVIVYTYTCNYLCTCRTRVCVYATRPQVSYVSGS